MILLGEIHFHYVAAPAISKLPEDQVQSRYSNIAEELNNFSDEILWDNKNQEERTLSDIFDASLFLNVPFLYFVNSSHNFWLY